jgi:hypothetical protein
MIKFAAFAFVLMNPTADEELSGGNSLKPEPLTERQRKDARNARERERRAARKCKAETKKGTEFTTVSSAGEDTDEEAKKKKKKARKKVAKRPVDIFEVSDEDNEPPKRFTVYFDIEGPKSATPTAACSKTTPPLVIKKGPFFHHTNALFKETIGSLTPCNPNLLVLPSLTWKFDTPANGVRRLMPNEVGYEAMLAAVRAKRGECVVFVYMLPPKKDMVQNHLLFAYRNSPLLQTWPTGDPNQVLDPFDYDEVVATQLLQGLT